MAEDELIAKLLKRGGTASAAELEKLAKELTGAKLAEMNDAIRRGTIDRPVKVITLDSERSCLPRGLVDTSRRSGTF